MSVQYFSTLKSKTYEFKLTFNFRNLYYAGERFNLAGRMKIEQFSPRKDFMLPGFFTPREVEEFILEKQVSHCTCY